MYSVESVDNEDDYESPKRARLENECNFIHVNVLNNK